MICFNCYTEFHVQNHYVPIAVFVIGVGILHVFIMI